MSLHYRMACQATGGGGTLAISAGWSLMFLLVDICKAFLWNPYLPNVPPPSQPLILFVLCSQRGFYCWVFLCVFCFPGAEAGSNTWCGRHSPLKICRFSPTNASVNLCGVTACGHLVLLLERALRLTLSQR